MRSFVFQPILLELYLNSQLPTFPMMFQLHIAPVLSNCLGFPPLEQCKKNVDFAKILIHIYDELNRVNIY